MNFDRHPIGLFGDVMTLSQGRPVFTADFYAVDSVTLNVSAFIDWNDFSHMLTQSGGASLQVAIPTAHADFGGKLCATFTGSEWYRSNRLSSTFIYLHTGPFESTHVYTSTSFAGNMVIAGTASIDVNNGIGYAHWFSTAPRVRLWVANGTSSVFDLFAAAPAVNVPTYSTVGMSQQNPAGVVYVKSVLGTSGNVTASPSVSTSVGTLTLGAPGTASPSLKFVGRWRSGVYSPSIGIVEQQAKQSWIQQDTGIAP